MNTVQADTNQVASGFRRESESETRAGPSRACRDLLGTSSLRKETYRRVALVSHPRHLQQLDVEDDDTLVVSCNWLLWQRAAEEGWNCIHAESHTTQAVRGEGPRVGSVRDLSGLDVHERHGRNPVSRCLTRQKVQSGNFIVVGRVRLYGPHPGKPRSSIRAGRIGLFRLPWQALRPQRLGPFCHRNGCFPPTRNRVDRQKRSSQR